MQDVDLFSIKYLFVTATLDRWLLYLPGSPDGVEREKAATVKYRLITLGVYDKIYIHEIANIDSRTNATGHRQNYEFS
jgi:hypothetical protein